MADLYRLESPEHPTAGGVLICFPSGYRCTATWRSRVPVSDSLALAKDLVARVVDHMLRGGKVDDLERTNLVSLVAGVKKMVVDWNLRVGGGVGGGRGALQERGVTPS